jgi:hypothetical protein
LDSGNSIIFLGFWPLCVLLWASGSPIFLSFLFDSFCSGAGVPHLLSKWPRRMSYLHLHAVIRTLGLAPASAKAAA